MVLKVSVLFVSNSTLPPLVILLPCASKSPPSCGVVSVTISPAGILVRLLASRAGNAPLKFAAGIVLFTPSTSTVLSSPNTLPVISPSYLSSFQCLTKMYSSPNAVASFHLSIS